jgi:phage tail sheath gpL-like
MDFNSVPSNLLIPFMAVEIDNSQANQGPSELAYRHLIIGQKTSGGTATANTLYRVTSADQVATLAGRGSMLHGQAVAHFASNKQTETWIMPVADNGAGVAATGNVTFGGTATAAGTLSFWVGDDLVEVAVAVGDTGATVSAAFVAALAAKLDLPITAAVDGSVAAKANLTYRHKGLIGNELALAHSLNDGEALPAGVTCTIVAMSGGTTAPSLTSAIAALGDQWFHVITMPYTDATSLSAMEAELLDRNGPMRQIPGQCYVGSGSTFGTLTTLGGTRNSPFVSVVPTNGSPTISYKVAANAAAEVSKSAAADAALPFQTLPLVAVKAPSASSEWSNDERNQLLLAGISTIKSGPGGLMQIDRLVTTYKTNAAGAADPSYRDANTMHTLIYLRYSFRTQIQTKYARAKLADSAKNIGAGQKVLTPKIAKSEALHWFHEMEQKGLVENFDLFKANLVVERDATNRGQMNWLLPPQLIGQFIVGAAQVQFRL